MASESNRVEHNVGETEFRQFSKQLYTTWLEIPVSGTLDIVTLSYNKYGLNIHKLSTKFTPCQVTFRLCLQNSTNADIGRLYNETSKDINVQYDTYKNTLEVIKNTRLETKDRIENELTTQKLVIKSIRNHADDHFNIYWRKTINRLPKYIYNFVIRYLNNTLANATNTFKWKFRTNLYCNFCHARQTLGHDVGSCSVFLQEKRYTWRHNSVMLNNANSIPRNQNITLYVDLDMFALPSIISGDEQRPDMIIKRNNDLWILELSVGFETNLEKNRNAKNLRYNTLIQRLKTTYRKVKFINLSLGAIGVYSKSQGTFSNLLSDLEVDKTHSSYVLSKISYVCIRKTYYLFCLTNKD